MTAESPRQFLSYFHSLDHVVDLLKRAKRIIVVSGAGISVSAGIPDFRSKDGLYNTLNCEEIGIPSAELLFDLDFFDIDPQPFYKFAKCLLPSDAKPSACHRFLYSLQNRKKLLRNYTQNVDGLERRVGLTQLVECHGSMSSFRCTGAKCNKKQPLESVADNVRQGQVCFCQCGEVLKPEVTFFGEKLPKSLFTKIQKDVLKCDLLLVVGTSLKVEGSVHEVLRGINPSVPQVLINRDAVALPVSWSMGFDVSVLGQCDDVAHYLSARLEWESLEEDLDNHANATDATMPLVSGFNDSPCKVQAADPLCAVPSAAVAEGATSRPSKKRKSSGNAGDLIRLQHWTCVQDAERVWRVCKAGDGGPAVVTEGIH